jgi:hypothetical protein
LTLSPNDFKAFIYLFFFFTKGIRAAGTCIEEGEGERVEVFSLIFI